MKLSWRVWLIACLATFGGCDLFAPPEPQQVDAGPDALQHEERPFDGGPFGDAKIDQDPERAANALPLEMTGRVIRVGDGDTITIEDPSGKTWKIRLVGIDAPELAQPSGEASRAALFKMTRGKNVRVRWDERDQFDRVLGQVFLDNINVNEAQVRAGWAWKYLHSHDAGLGKAEREARSKRVGLWKDADPTPPWEFRREEQRRSPRR